MNKLNKNFFNKFYEMKKIIMKMSEIIFKNLNDLKIYLFNKI